MKISQKTDLIEIKEILEVISEKVEQLNLVQSASAETIRSIKDQQSVINTKLNKIAKTQQDHTEKIDKLTRDMIMVETTTKGIHELLKSTRDRQQAEIDELKKRLNVF